mgnify:CR=1 FL=1
MKIKYLTDSKKDIPKVIDWLYEQWGGNYEYGRNVWKKRINNRLEKKTVPTTFVALIDGEAVATASLIKHDMDTRKDLTPWLADVFVKKDYRKRGIASSLVKRVITEAEEIGFSKIYLYSREAEGLYKKLGWKLIERTNYYGDEVPIMVYKIN